MYKISINEKLEVLDVFDTEVYLDESVTTYPITNAEFTQIRDSGRHNFWQYKNGVVVESEFKNKILKEMFNFQQKQKREDAYKAESDPINFMYQRGEATQEEWLAKVADIKARFPYQE
jgi:hypothetical protein